MTPLTYDMEGWRNAPFPPDVFTVTDGGTPVDITSWDFGLDVRAYGGAPAALISLNATDAPSTNGVLVLSGVAGTFRVQIDQATMQAAWDAAYGAELCKAGEPARLVYDIRPIQSDGVADVICEGAFIIQPGVTL